MLMVLVQQTLVVAVVAVVDNSPVLVAVVQAVLALLFYVTHQLTQLQLVQD
jgi:hypothetical protein